MAIEAPDAVQFIGELIRASEHVAFSVHKRKERIDVFKEKNIYFLSSGNVKAYSNRDNFVIYNIIGPEIICLEKLNDIDVIDYLRCHTDCELYKISTDIMKEMLNAHGLWSFAFDILMNYVRAFQDRELRINQPSVMNSVILHIKYIWALRPAQRDVTSVYTFILDRMKISRSALHKTISELQKKGLITLKRGVLKNCNLP